MGQLARMQTLPIITEHDSSHIRVNNNKLRQKWWGGGGGGNVSTSRVQTLALLFSGILIPLKNIVSLANFTDFNGHTNGFHLE